MNRLDLNLLISLDALFRSNSVTKAATELGLSQSAMSYNLRRLRDLMGDELFTRTSNGLITTPYAKTLAEPLSKALVDIQSLVTRNTQFNPLTEQRAFRLAVPDAAEVILIPEIVNRLERLAPGIRLDLLPADGRNVLEDLDSGRVDLAIGVFTDGQVHHKRKLLHTDDYLCIYNEALVGRDLTSSLEDFLGVPHVVFTDRTGLADAVGEALARLDSVRRVLVSTPHLLSIPYIVQRTASVAVIHGVLAKRFAALLGLKVAPPPLPLPSIPISSVWHSSYEGDAAHKWLRSLIAEVVVATRALDAQ